jgi:hypothetical protein
MKTAGEVVELIGVESQSANGCNVEGNDTYRRTSIEKRSGTAETLPAAQSIHAERPRPAG